MYIQRYGMFTRSHHPKGKTYAKRIHRILTDSSFSHTALFCRKTYYIYCGITRGPKARHTLEPELAHTDGHRAITTSFQLDLMKAATCLNGETTTTASGCTFTAHETLRRYTPVQPQHDNSMYTPHHHKPNTEAHHQTQRKASPT